MDKVIDIEIKKYEDGYMWRISKQNEDIFPLGSFRDYSLDVFSEDYMGLDMGEFEYQLFIKGRLTEDDDWDICTPDELRYIKSIIEALNEKYGTNDVIMTAKHIKKAEFQANKLAWILIIEGGIWKPKLVTMGKYPCAMFFHIKGNLSTLVNYLNTAKVAPSDFRIACKKLGIF